MKSPSFAHVLTMTDRIGMFEHAEYADPLPVHGYCVDDVARLLIVLVREPPRSEALREVGRTAFRFLADSQDVHGRIRNRRNARGRWQGRHGVEDCWGRSVWAFGTAARLAPEDSVRSSALSYFNHGVVQRSPHLRSMAFAALGAAEVLTLDPRHSRARSLLSDAVDVIEARPNDAHPPTANWPWPEPRLTYANASVAEALIAAGYLLDRAAVADRGLTLLRWLLDRETLDGHLSPTPVGGAGPDDSPPRFDQQPIEVAAMADACARALAVTADPAWQRGIDLAVGWFAGDNDCAAVMWDAETGGGYDGLTGTGPNRNQGAESTLAMLATMQYARSPVGAVGHSPGFRWAPGANAAPLARVVQ